MGTTVRGCSGLPSFAALRKVMRNLTGENAEARQTPPNARGRGRSEARWAEPWGAQEQGPEVTKTWP